MLYIPHGAINRIVSLFEAILCEYKNINMTAQIKRMIYVLPKPPNKHQEVRKTLSIHLISHFLFSLVPQITGCQTTSFSLVHFKLAIAYGIEHMIIPHTWMSTKTYPPENVHTPENLMQWGFGMYFLRVTRGTSAQNVLVYQTCVRLGCVRVCQ